MTTQPPHQVPPLCMLHGVIARALAAALCLTLSATAWAGPSAEELVVARQLFEEAVASEKKNDWNTCVQRLSKALSIVETPGLRFHLAHCEEQKHQWIEALVDYKRAAELIAGGVEANDVEPLLEPAVARLEAKVPRLVVRLPNPPERLSFFLDGKERSPSLLGTTLQLNPGSHVIEVSAAGYSSVRRSVSLNEGEVKELSLRMEQNGQLVQASSAGAGEVGDGGSLPRARSNRVSAKPFVLAAEGLVFAAAAGVGTYQLLKAVGIDDDKKIVISDFGVGVCVVDTPTYDARGCRALGKLNNTQDDYRRYATYSFIGAGVAAAILATTWIAWDDRPRVVIALDPAARSASVGLAGAF